VHRRTQHKGNTQKYYKRHRSEQVDNSEIPDIPVDLLDILNEPDFALPFVEYDDVMLDEIVTQDRKAEAHEG
jgi:hypothetical protein